MRSAAEPALRPRVARAGLERMIGRQVRVDRAAFGAAAVGPAVAGLGAGNIAGVA